LKASRLNDIAEEDDVDDINEEMACMSIGDNTLGLMSTMKAEQAKVKAAHSPAKVSFASNTMKSPPPTMRSPIQSPSTTIYTTATVSTKPGFMSIGCPYWIEKWVDPKTVTKRVSLQFTPLVTMNQKNTTVKVNETLTQVVIQCALPLEMTTPGNAYNDLVLAKMSEAKAEAGEEINAAMVNIALEYHAKGTARNNNYSKVKSTMSYITMEQIIDLPWPCRREPVTVHEDELFYGANWFANSFFLELIINDAGPPIYSAEAQCPPPNYESRSTRDDQSCSRFSKTNDIPGTVTTEGSFHSKSHASDTHMNEDDDTSTIATGDHWDFTTNSAKSDYQPNKKKPRTGSIANSKHSKRTTASKRKVDDRSMTGKSPLNPIQVDVSVEPNESHAVDVSPSKSMGTRKTIQSTGTRKATSSKFTVSSKKSEVEDKKPAGDAKSTSSRKTTSSKFTVSSKKSEVEEKKPAAVDKRDAKSTSSRKTTTTARTSSMFAKSVSTNNVATNRMAHQTQHSPTFARIPMTLNVNPNHASNIHGVNVSPMSRGGPKILTPRRSPRGAKQGKKD